MKLLGQILMVLVIVGISSAITVSITLKRVSEKNLVDSSILATSVAEESENSISDETKRGRKPNSETVTDEVEARAQSTGYSFSKTLSFKGVSTGE